MESSNLETGNIKSKEEVGQHVDTLYPEVLVNQDLFGDAVVVATDAGHEKDEGGNEDGGDPGAVFELGNEDDEQGDAGGDGSDGVDEDAVPGARAGLAHPVNDHACLREGEG